MKYRIFPSNEELYLKVARELTTLDFKTLGVATGSTMKPLYQELTRLGKENKVHWEDKVLFLLDEFYPLQKEHPASFYSFIKIHLLNKIKVKEFYYWNSDIKDTKKECLRYEKIITDNNGMDLQLLGLGTNGHIAFNEPGSSKNSRARMVSLADSTRKANQNLFLNEESTPKNALSLGVKNILEAKKIYMIAIGEKKAEAVRNIVEGSESSDWPASFLKEHSNFYLFLDQKAASLLTTTKET